MNNMGGEDDLPDLDGADDDESADSDDEKMPDLEWKNSNLEEGWKEESNYLEIEDWGKKICTDMSR